MNKTIIFSDLEGTILRESDNSYSDEDMFIFLQTLNTFSNITNSTLQMHLVSPVSSTAMNKYLDQIDQNIRSFNKITHNRLPFIHSAYCSFDNKSTIKLPSNIIATKPPTADNFLSWKSIYVNDVCREFIEREPDNNFSFIYLGNGRNDIRAMEMVKRANGIGICPKNSRTAVKSVSNFVGQYEDLRGITDGLNQYIKILQPPEQNVNESIGTEK